MINYKKPIYSERRGFIIDEDIGNCRKPSVGRDIARVLQCTRNSQGALEGEKYIVTWALGHLVTLADPEGYDAKYKSWRVNLPMILQHFVFVVIKQTQTISDCGKENPVAAQRRGDNCHCNRCWQGR